MDDLIHRDAFAVGIVGGDREGEHHLAIGWMRVRAVRPDIAHRKSEGMFFMLQGVQDRLPSGKELSLGRPEPQRVLIQIREEERQVVLIIGSHNING